jgi:biopolymer transport protein TolR
MAFRRQTRPLSQINVVPYIDVVLVLLVIFMVTAPMITPGIIDVPSVGKVNNAPAQPIEVQINAGGRIVVIDHDVSGKPREVNREELAAFVTAKQQIKRDQPVIITADKEIKYDLVLQTMDLLQRKGVENVGLLAVPKQ